MHNQLIAFHNRVCGRVPEADPLQMRGLRKYMARLARSLPQATPWTLDEVVNSYHGPKRNRYSAAAHESRTHGLTKTQANVSAFIKCEKIRYQETKENPDPRAIQFRNPVFAVNLATFIKPIEDVVYRLRGNRLNNCPPTPVFGKSLDSVARAKLLQEKLRAFKEPVVLSLDASRFDQHFGVMHLQCLHMFYLILIRSPYFQMLLSWTIVNKVRTSKNLKYTATGGRMSGDMDTALGACLLMFSMLGYMFESLTVHWDCLDDGDDILLILESADYGSVITQKMIESHFLSLGQEIKVENVAYDMEGVVWCQASPVWVCGRYKFTRNPAKVLSGALVGPKWVQMRSERSRRALANTIGLCEAHLNKGVPVLQFFAQTIIVNANTKRQVRLSHSDSLIYKVRHELGKSWLDTIPTVEAVPVDDESRLSFARAFGISITEQLEYERFFDKWEINFGEPVLQGPPVDVNTWEWQAFNDERY